MLTSTFTGCAARCSRSWGGLPRHGTHCSVPSPWQNPLRKPNSFDANWIASRSPRRVIFMVHTVVDGTFRQTNLTGESSAYLARREELRLAEIELMRQREQVAELRRNLPAGAAIQDYQFEEGPRDLNAGDTPVSTVRLSELFTKPSRS